MATINIKRIVCNAVANYLANNVAGLSGKVSAKAEGPEKDTAFPSVALVSNTFSFEPEDPDEVYWNEVDDGSVVLSVGEFRGEAELRLYAKSVPERELYEQRIMDLFLSQEGSPGTLYITTPTLTVNGYVSLHSVEIKVRLNSEEWREEFAMEDRRYAFIDITFGYPALTTRNAHTVESLQTTLADMASNAQDTTEVQEDGTLVLVP